MIEFQSVKGIPFIVDDCDAELVSKYRWWVGKDLYPCTKINGRPIRLHQLLLGTLPKRKVVDHINRNRLDNRRDNLRIVEYRKNVINAGTRSNNRSGHKGVFFDRQTQKWRVQITVCGVVHSIGRFDLLSDAVNARQKAETEYGYDT